MLGEGRVLRSLPTHLALRRTRLVTEYLYHFGVVEGELCKAISTQVVNMRFEDFTLVYTLSRTSSLCSKLFVALMRSSTTRVRLFPCTEPEWPLGRASEVVASCGVSGAVTAAVADVPDKDLCDTHLYECVGSE